MEEGFSVGEKPYVEATPLYALARSVLAHPVGFEDFYYMDLSEYTRLILETVEYAGRRKGWEAAMEVLVAARRLGLSKDPPLVAAHRLPGWRMASQLLSTYPVSKMWLYLELARKQEQLGVPLGYGARKRRAVAEALAGKPVEWQEYQAMKYPSRFRDLLRMAHPRPPTREHEALWGWIVGKRPPPSDRAEAYEKIRSGGVSGEEAVQLAIDYGLPWEVVRSRIGGLRELDPGLVWEAASKLMTGWDLAMQASTLAEILGEEKTAKLIAVRERAIPASAAARAALGLAMRGIPRLADQMWRLSTLKVWEWWGRFLSKLSAPSGMTFLVDISLSMGGGPITAAARILLGFSPEKALLFNDCIGVKPYSLDSLEAYLRLVRMPDCGTPLYSAMEEALEKWVEPDEMLVVLTDEQENASDITVDYLGTVIEEKKAWVSIINVAPYPADMVPKQPLTRVIGLPGASPDAVLAAATLVSVVKEQSEGVAEEAFLEKLARLIEKQFRPGLD